MTPKLVRSAWKLLVDFLTSLVSDKKEIQWAKRVAEKTDGKVFPLKSWESCGDIWRVWISDPEGIVPDGPFFTDDIRVINSIVKTRKVRFRYEEIPLDPYFGMNGKWKFWTNPFAYLHAIS